MASSNNQEPGTEGEKSPKDLAQDEVTRIIKEVQQRGGFRIFSPDDMQILVSWMLLAKASFIGNNAVITFELHR